MSNFNIINLIFQRTSKLMPLITAIAIFATVPGCQFSLLQPETQTKILNETPTETPNQVEISIITDPTLPRLNLQMLEVLKNHARDRVESWLGLAGLGKVIAPSEFTESLQLYRKTWLQRDRDIAPFLGLWHDDGSGLENLYFLSIFPSNQQKQVCILEFRPEYSVKTIDSENNIHSDVITEGIIIFSTATVSQGQLIGSRLRTDQSVIIQKDFSNYSTEILTIFNHQGDVYSFSTQSPPIIPSKFPSELYSTVLEELGKKECVIEEENR